MTLSDPISKSAATPGRKCDTRSILLPQWVAKAPSKRHHTPQHPHQIFRFGKLLGTQARVLLSRPCGSDSALIAGMRTNGQPAESHAVPAAPFRPAAANATSTAMRSRCGTQQHGRMVTRYDSHTGWMPPSLPQNDTCTHSPFDAPTPHPFQDAGACTFPQSPGILNSLHNNHFTKQPGTSNIEMAAKWTRAYSQNVLFRLPVDTVENGPPPPAPFQDRKNRQLQPRNCSKVEKPYFGMRSSGPLIEP